MFQSVNTAALVASLLLSLTGNAYATASLSLKVSGAETILGVDDFKVLATVTNTGNETLRLYKDPGSAISSFPDETFSITSEAGVAPGFVGARAKYVFSQDTDLVTLEPGTNISVAHDLGIAYDFTQEGSYKIESSNLFYYQDESGSPQVIYATASSAHEAKLKGSLRSSKRPDPGLRKRSTFTRCTDSQVTGIRNSFLTVKNYLADSVDHLTSTSGANPRHNTWFGRYDATRRQEVLSHFKRIQTSDPSTYNYDCTCNPGIGHDPAKIFAYVNPTIFGVVHLCGKFWEAPVSGTDSKAGTIIHEASHFNRNGGTQDHIYGQPKCKALALSDPAKAIFNADSHEYFAENNPFLQ